MRVLALGLTVLGLAVALVATRDAPELSMQVPVDRGQVEPEPGSPLRASGAGAAHALASPAKAVGGPGPEVARSDGVASAAMLAEPAGPAVRSRYRATGSIPEVKPVVAGSAATIRTFTPGSRAHSEAIASVVGSDESRDTVQPLARLYFAYFNRAPDHEGLDYYIGERDRGTPLDSIADEFAASREFEMRYGAVDNATFIDRVHQNVAGGPPDAAQRAYWLGQLDSGRMTRGEVMLAFSESTGFRASTANSVFVTMAYAETLRRMPDPAELGRWVSFLDAGNPRRAVIDELLAGPRPR